MEVTRGQGLRYEDAHRQLGRLRRPRPVLPDHRGRLDGLAGHGHFFDLLAEDAVFEFVITVPGYPRRVGGRAALDELYRPYGTAIVLDRCFDLAVHHDPAQGTVVLEYASAGKVVNTGAAYGNHYISVLTLRDREVVHWRDYLDPVAVFDALGWPSR